MPPRDYHLAFDEILRNNGIICDDTYGDSVHKRLDKHSKKFGAMHREIDEWHSTNGIRDFIDNLINGLGTIYQETATDYIRIAYGHIVLDEIASQFKINFNCDYNELDWEEVFKEVFKEYKKFGFHKTKYHRSG